MNRLLFRANALVIGAAFTLLTSACGGPSLLGSLSATSNQAFQRVAASLLDVGQLNARLQTTTLATVSCITATNPPVTKTGTIESNGSFNVDLSAVVGQPVTCTVLGASGAILATFTFLNSSQADIGGSSLQQDTVAISTATNVGSVVVNESTGKIDVDVVSLGLSTGAADITAAEAFDFSGQWTVGSPDFSIPTGYIGPCAVGDGDCHGPTTGTSLFLVRLEGADFTPDAACASEVTADTFTSSSSCAGTTGTKTKFGVQVWQAAHDSVDNPVTSCGNKLGFTFDQAKAYGHIDLTTQTTATSGAFTWTSPLPNAHTVADGWKDPAATSNYNINNCSNTTLSDGTNAWKCIDTTHNTYQLNVAGGGCVDSNGDAFRVNDWTLNTVNSCTTSSVSHGSITLQKNLCSTTYNSATSLTCSNEFGIFHVADNTAIPVADWGANFDFNNTVLVTSGAACSTISDSNMLQKYQCYSNGYQTLYDLYRNDASVCFRNLRMNWGAPTAAEFLIHNGPDQPATQFATEIFTYTAADSGTFTHAQTNQRGVRSGGNGYVPCEVQETTSVTMTKIDSTHMLAKFRQEIHMTDTQAICVANASSLNDGQVIRGMFKLTKN